MFSNVEIRYEFRQQFITDQSVWSRRILEIPYFVENFPVNSVLFMVVSVLGMQRLSRTGRI